MRLNRISLLALFIASLILPARAQHGAGTEGPVHYRVFDAAGEASSLDAVVSAALEADVVFVGEEHNDPIAHWLQAELLKRLVDESGDRPVALSLEMFERDVQHVVDEYLQGQITEDHFKKSARAWSNYDSDYRPMVEAARKAGVPVIAANAPRRYVNRVSRSGSESLADLSPRARAWLPPLPYEGASEEYTAQFNAMMAEQMAEIQSASKTESDEAEAGGCKCGKGKGMHGAMGDSTAAGMHGREGAMHGRMHMRGDSAASMGDGCPHCRMMRGDSTASAGHSMMGSMHGRMQMHGDSAGTSCPRCKMMKADSTAAHTMVGEGHGKRMMMHRDSSAAGGPQCRGCRHRAGASAAREDETAMPAGMPDDEIHRPFRQDAEDEAAETSSAMPSGGMHSAMAGMLDAQALWDATMAHSIATFLETEPEALVMHAAGGFHVEHGTGIPEQLPLYHPSAKQLVVAIRSADDVGAFDEEDRGRGDFVILTDASLPRSYESRTD